MPTISLRVPEADYEEWKKKAGDRALSDWIRERCNESGGVPSVREEDGVRAPGGRKSGAKGIDGLPVLGKGVERGVTERVCPHGTPRGYHCWQCGGLAEVE